MEWIDRKNKEIPNDIDVLVIWKGRFGILRKEEGKIYCSICPGEMDKVMEMDQECYSKIKYWMYFPDPIFRKEISELT